MYNLFKKGMLIMMCTILALGCVSCKPRTAVSGTTEPISESGIINNTTGTAATETGTPEITPEPTPVITPAASISTIYKKCVIVSLEQGRQYEKKAADQFYEFIKDKLETVQVTAAGTQNSGKDVLTVYIGDTQDNYAQQKWNEFGKTGYIINGKDNAIILRGSSAENTYIAVSRFIHEFMQGNADNISNIDMKAGIKEEYAFASRDEYIADISKFTAVWEYEWQPPAWIMDFEGKLKAFTNRRGRPICYAHRGDLESYPENSIEGIISAVKRGADMIELDAYMTRDKVLVLMHTSDLSITTDWALKRGKTINGIKLPNSTDLSQWSYEQLCQLNLRTGNGTYADANSEITDYKIPTLKEAFTVCKERCFLVIDRLNAGYWEKIYGIIKETKAYTSFTYTILAESETEANKYRDIMLKECGAAGPTCYQRGCAWSGDHFAEFSLKTDEDFGKYYRSQFNKGCFILTNRVSRLIDYIDRNYNPSKSG